MLLNGGEYVIILPPTRNSFFFAESNTSSKGGEVKEGLYLRELVKLCIDECLVWFGLVFIIIFFPTLC